MLTFMIIMVSITFICVALVTAMGVDIDKPIVKKSLVKPEQAIKKRKGAGKNQ